MSSLPYVLDKNLKHDKIELFKPSPAAKAAAPIR
jgi:hypothetical protein